MHCATHNLAADPSGQCVLCRRPPMSASPALALAAPSRGALTALCGAALLAMAALAWWKVGHEAVANRTEPQGAEAARPAGQARVIVYTTSWCPTCRKAKAWMHDKGVVFEERDIEADRTFAKQMHRINPRNSIPTFDVEGDVFVGFSSDWLERELRHHGS